MVNRSGNIIQFRMLKALLNYFLFSILLLSLNSLALAQESSIAELAFSPKDRVLILAPHPDDEVLGSGGVMQRAVAMKLPMKVVYFTNGDSNPWSFLLYRKHPVIMPGAVKTMGVVRMQEALDATGILGVDKKDLIFLGYPDFGTLNIWYQHWDTRAAYRSPLTRANAVPYQGAFRLGAAYKGEEIVKDLRSILRDFKPTKIFISHPADHNGDHLSLYLYMRVALWDENISDSVEIYPYLIHYLGWPNPKGLKMKYPLNPPESLSKIISWRTLQLTEKELNLKKEALQAHRSQFASTPKYLLSFVRSNELFGDFSVVKLHMDNDSSVFTSRRKLVTVAELPDEFSSREKTSFIGVEWKFIRWEGEDLIVSIELSKPLARDVQAFIYIFGYNKNVAFAKMPKISVRLGSNNYTVYDQAHRMNRAAAIRIKRTPKEITLAVPLKLLGNPDKILTSARTYLDNVPLDSASWIAVELN